jgi:hypothetical protein
MYGLTMRGKPGFVSSAAARAHLCLLLNNRDKVEWDEEQEQLARAAVERQMSAAVPLDLQEEYNADPASFWDSFYANVKGASSPGLLEGRGASC